MKNFIVREPNRCSENPSRYESPLIKLYLRRNEITRIASIAHFKELEYLDLRYNAVNHIENLAALPRLKKSIPR
ncbi:MAG: hypothetical protein RBG13Loki_0631 [Promethearchaeota archaeon CR_4]|nr:MAG: hypothetical protein RBG13Loki_0631 [Candidatus Lokiarchaeota archaeon CR_4]